MKENEVNELSRRLSESYGLGITGQLIPHGFTQQISFKPKDLHINESFEMVVEIGWRSLTASLVLGKFAEPLLRAMEDAGDEKHQLFATLVSSLRAQRTLVQFQLGDLSQDPTVPNSWPVSWSGFTLRMSRLGLEINTDDFALSHQLVSQWIEKFYSCCLSLMPLEENTSESELRGMPEGAKTLVLVNRYERSRFNRAVCLNANGHACAVCHFQFSKVYGTLGDSFIHVHHLVPVSQLGPDYRLNPIQDLIPVCPNCHAMLHRKDPPLRPEELSALIASVRDAAADA